MPPLRGSPSEPTRLSAPSARPSPNRTRRCSSRLGRFEHYLARRGTPKSPADLVTHACLAYTRPDGRDAPFLFGAEEPLELVRVAGPIRSDDMHHLAAMAVAGIGVAQLPHFAVARELETKTLIRILERHEPEPKLASLVFPAGRIIPRRVRVLADRLVSPSSELPGTTAKRAAKAGR